MLGHRELGVSDYLAMLRRRGLLIGACAVLCLIIGVIVSHVIPASYMSQTLVLIEQPQVNNDIVKQVVNEDIGGRLASMREQIESRSELIPIIQKFNLFPEKNLTLDDRVEEARKAIAINAIPMSHAGSMPGFFISYKASDPHLAQQVCAEITNIFVSENLREREEKVVGTTQFLKTQLDDAKRDLDSQDAKLADFEKKHLGSLPQQDGVNSATLTSLTQQLDAQALNVSHAQQQVTIIESVLANASANVEAQSHVDSTGSSVDSLRAQLRELKHQRDELMTIDTPDHPDVIAANRQIASLEAQISRDAAAAPVKSTAVSSRPESPEIAQLRARLRAAQQEVTNAREQQARIQGMVGQYEGRLQSSPVVEQEYKQIMRDHDISTQHYNELLSQKNASMEGEQLERRQQGEQFRIQDGANLPDDPYFPDRKKFAMGGVALGLLFGLIIAAILEYRDTTLRSDKDIFAFTKLPTLAVISYVDMPTLLGKKPWWQFFNRSQQGQGTGAD